MKAIGELELSVDRAASELARPGHPDLARLGADRRDADAQPEALDDRGASALGPAAAFPRGGGRAPVDEYDPGDAWRLEQLVAVMLADCPEDGSDSAWACWGVVAEACGLFGLGEVLGPVPDGLEPSRAERRRRLAAWLADRRSPGTP